MDIEGVGCGEKTRGGGGGGDIEGVGCGEKTREGGTLKEWGVERRHGGGGGH